MEAFVIRIGSLFRVPLYKDSLFGMTPPSFIPPFEADLGVSAYFTPWGSEFRALALVP